MDKLDLMTGIMLFLTGVLIGSIVLGISAISDPDSNLQITSNSLSLEAYFDQMVAGEGQTVRDIPSPKERVSKDNVFVYDDQVILRIDNPQWAVFADTKSMDPVIDSQSKAIEIVPQTSADILVGDIVAYDSKYSDGIIAHRVVEIGNDENGWFARLKGDNNNSIDPEKVRFDQVKRVVVAIIY